MAATGLLGVNPYYKGVEIDVSKPVNLAIQIEQKNQAKREAIDKYFMDYEKSLNSAGMRQQDQDVFLRKLQENKAYYLKNRDKILNPAKYGAEAQSEYMSRFKGILSDIDRSKQLAANGKVIATAVLDAKKNNRTIPEEVTDAIYNNQLSIGDSNHIDFDPINFDAYDKHDPFKYQQNIYSRIKTSESIPIRRENKKTNEVYFETINDIPKSAFSEIQTVVDSELRKDRGLADIAKELGRDENKLNQLAKVFQDFSGKKFNPNSLNDIATAYTIALKPPPQSKYTTPSESKAFSRYEADRLIRERKADFGEEGGDPVDVFLTEARSGKTFAGAEGENIEIMNLPETITRDLGKNKRPAIIGRGLGDGEYYNIVYQLDRNGVKTDLIDWTKTEKLPPSQIRASVVARALPSDTKVRLTGIGGTKTKSAGSGKETLADRMRRLKNPK